MHKTIMKNQTETIAKTLFTTVSIISMAAIVIFGIHSIDKASVRNDSVKPSMPPLPPMPERGQAVESITHYNEGPVVFVFITAGTPKVLVTGTNTFHEIQIRTNTVIQLGGKLWGSTNFTYHGIPLKGIGE